MNIQHLNTHSTGFAERILTWFEEHGRKDLPWQQNITPYRVWISEIMLQQTQVKIVIPYYERFMQSFPTVEDLANADEDSILNHWSGLGYYARARNLHASAKMICETFSGEFPNTQEAIESLPGIGRSTASAIRSIAFKQRASILDGNVKRVLARHHAISGWPGKASVLKALWDVADNNLPIGTKTYDQNHANYSQAMMDLGSMVCTRTKPHCEACPVNETCKAYLNDTIEQYPGKKIKKALPEKSAYALIVELNDADNTSTKIYLEKRPPSGIWGGLWCFPQFESLTEANTWLGSHEFPTDCLDEYDELETIIHTFSHFRLHLTPIRIVLNSNQSGSHQINEKPLEQWMLLDKEFDGGLAKPTQIIIDKLRDSA